MQIGRIDIHRVVESICRDFDPRGFFPETTADR